MTDRWLSVISEHSTWLPRHMVVSAWHEHAPFASWLIAATRPRTVVELGTHNGFSFFVMCEAAKRLRLKTQLHAIDTWAGDDHAGYYSNDTFEYVQAVTETEYPNAHLIRSYFSDAVNQFEDGSIDLLHIDGRHDYEDVKEDYETYLPKLSSRAVVLFHDTTEPTFGVHQFWAELEHTRPSFNFHHGHGLGVLAFGNQPPPKLTKFIHTAQESPNTVRTTYHRLGQHLVNVCS